MSNTATQRTYFSGRRQLCHRSSGVLVDWLQPVEIHVILTVYSYSTMNEHQNICHLDVFILDSSQQTQVVKALEGVFCQACSEIYDWNCIFLQKTYTTSQTPQFMCALEVKTMRTFTTQAENKDMHEFDCC